MTKFDLSRRLDVDVRWGPIVNKQMEGPHAKGAG